MPKFIMLQVWDCLGKAHCSAYGYEKPTTPNLEALGKDGWILDGRAQSTWTLGSMAALLTGLPPEHCGRYRIAREGYREEGPLIEAPNLDDLKTGQAKEQAQREWLRTLPPLGETIFERMAAKGYRTVWIAGCPYAGEDTLGKDRPNPASEYHEVVACAGPRLALEYAAAWDGTPTFVLVHTFLSHMPWSQAYRWFVDENLLPERRYAWIADAMAAHEAGKQDIVEYVRGLYCGGIRATDEHLKLLREILAGKDAVVAVTGDHGELWGEDGFGHGGERPLLKDVPMVLWRGAGELGVKPENPTHTWLHAKLLDLAARG
jgi:hypothetical protein